MVEDKIPPIPPRPPDVQVVNPKVKKANAQDDAAEVSAKSTPDKVDAKEPVIRNPPKHET